MKNCSINLDNDVSRSNPKKIMQTSKDKEII